jgi:hypothetical protein
MKSRTVCLALTLWLLAWPSPGLEPVVATAAAEDGIAHCVGPDGVTIFTDQRCSDLLAVEQVLPPPPVERPAVLVSVRTCPRNQDDFLFGVRMALESHDVNRLADFYHWAGMDTASGYRLMERLQAFGTRPLVDVQLVSERAPEATPPPVDHPLLDAYGFEQLRPTGEEAAPPPPTARPADLLRVDQMISDQDLGIRATYFRLRNNAGCWWMQF